MSALSSGKIKGGVLSGHFARVELVDDEHRSSYSPAAHLCETPSLQQAANDLNQVRCFLALPELNG